MNFLHRHPKECVGLTFADIREVQEAGGKMLEFQAQAAGLSGQIIASVVGRSK